MLKITGGERIQYTQSKWYQYEANRLRYNKTNIEKIFITRKYISGEDIVEYIVWSKYGAFLLLEEIREMKKKLRLLEDRIKSGIWLNKKTASICKLTSENLDIFYNNISNIDKMEEFTNLIHDDIYKSYFYNNIPNIYLPDPKTPQFPNLPRYSALIKESDKIIKLIENTIPYLNVLEKYHGNVYKLVSYCNEGLDKILSK